MDSLAGAVQIAGDKLLWQRRLLSARKLRRGPYRPRTPVARFDRTYHEY